MLEDTWAAAPGGGAHRVLFIGTHGTIRPEGNDWVVSSITYTLGDNVERLTLTGLDKINGTGTQVLVPADRVGELRTHMATLGLPKGKPTGIGQWQPGLTLIGKPSPHRPRGSTPPPAAGQGPGAAAGGRP